MVASPRLRNVALLTCGLVGLLAGCSGAGFDTGTPETGGDGGDDTGSDATDSGTPSDATDSGDSSTDGDTGKCDDTKAPKEQPCTLRDDLGVFVSSSLGDDANEGTKIKPLKTLAKALGAAKDKKKRLYACAEEFGEAVVAVDGVAAFGGVDCKGGWVGVTGQTTVKAPTSPAFTAKNLTVGAQFTNFSFVAPDGVGPGGSSIGGFAASSKLTFELCAFTAGNATNGTNGDLGDLGDNGSAGGFGENARTLAACPDRPLGGAGGVNYSAGGAGGSTCDASGGGSGKGKSATVNKAGTCGLGTEFDGGTGVCGTLVTGTGFLTGLDKGCPATDGTNGAAGKSLGALTADGLGPAPAGTDGTAGGNGGGGGGGGSGISGGSSGAGGGGGGGGGKGGGAGRGGKSGGSSIAFVSFNSEVVLSKTDLKVGDGGKGGAGGNGGFGGSGGKGSDGGVPKTSSNERGCRGGDGASGGNGGGGAGGGGGSAVGVLYVGTKPTRVAGTVTLGGAGTGGLGGSRAGGTKAPSGEDGVAVNEKGL